MRSAPLARIVTGVAMAMLVAFATSARADEDSEVSFDLSAANSVQGTGQQGSGTFTVSTTDSAFFDPGGVTVTFSGGATNQVPSGTQQPVFAGDASVVYLSTNTATSCGASSTNCDSITITFSKPVTTVSLELLNGSSISRSFIIAVNGISLGPIPPPSAGNANGGQTLDQTQLSALGGIVNSVTVTAPSTGFSFGIDDVKWTDFTPELASLPLCALGLGFVLVAGRKWTMLPAG